MLPSNVGGPQFLQLLQKEVSLVYRWYLVKKVKRKLGLLMGLLIFSYTRTMDLIIAEGIEALYFNFVEKAIPRRRLESHVGRYNFYVVRKGSSCGLYLNWLDCEREVKNFPKAQFKDF
jgi:hypothetical protein